jgi:hypothetical protein
LGKAGIHIPNFTVRRFGPGEQPNEFTPGDFLLTHARGWTSALIRVGESFRYWGDRAKYAHWSHAALICAPNGDIIEALGGGVQRRNISVYRDTEYHLVHLTPRSLQQKEIEKCERENAVAFAQHCLMDHYGFITNASLAIMLITGSKFSFGVDGQMICSGLVARCLERMGAIFKYDSWHMTPADVAEQFDVQPDKVSKRGNPPAADTGVMQRSK